MGLFDKIFRRDTEGTDIEVAFGLKQISNITREQALLSLIHISEPTRP